jgi:hypothetical protein
MYSRVYQTVGPPPLGGCTLGPRGGGVVCMRVIFILNEIWTEDGIHILVGTLLG